MRLLLDTHAFLWALQDPGRLSNTARGAMTDGENELLLSIASCWEMSIKHAAGRLGLPAPFAEFIEAEMRTTRISLLPISIQHLSSLVSLPRNTRDHRDPFDRLLVAQAIADAYGVKRLW